MQAPNITRLLRDHQFQPMGLTGRKFTVDGESNADSPDRETIDDVFRQAQDMAEPFMPSDNDSHPGWSKDLDRDWGSVLRTRSLKTPVVEHQLGLSVHYKLDENGMPENDKLVAFTMTENHGHLERKFEFGPDGQVESVVAKQFLQSGETETLTILQNEDGTITYEERIQREG